MVTGSRLFGTEDELIDVSRRKLKASVSTIFPLQSLVKMQTLRAKI